MKTGIITWTSYNNYGTVLQAYALQQYLDSLQIENTLVSDSPITEQKQKNISGVSMRRCLGALLHPRRLIARAGQKRADRKRSSYFSSKNRIEHFKNSDLRILRTNEQNFPDCLNDMFDAFICGSDQIWSTRDEIFNGYYYLNFTAKPKIAYAPSAWAAMKFRMLINR